MRKGKRKGKRDLDSARWLVHNISRSLGPPAANSFFDMLALSVPFAVTDVPPNRLFFLSFCLRGRVLYGLGCIRVTVGRSRLNF
jgi:hypothetical protein